MLNVFGYNSKNSLEHVKYGLLYSLLLIIAFIICLMPDYTIALQAIETNFNPETQNHISPYSNTVPDPKSLIENENTKIVNKRRSMDTMKIKSGFVDAFTASISVIIFTELGDKTFFIAAIMAMRHPRLIVFAGAISALALMTVLSVIFGMAATIVPKIYTYYISTALFAIFGLKMIYEGYFMTESNTNEELEEVQSDLRKREGELERDVGVSLVQDPESGVLRKNSKKGPTYVTTRVMMQAFTMTFLAEWGDRSQLTTIILAASKDVYGVVTGGIIGHSICTGLAVIGGRMVAAKISARTVTFIGGIVLLGFAFYAILMRPEDF